MSPTGTIGLAPSGGGGEDGPVRDLGLALDLPAPDCRPIACAGEDLASLDSPGAGVDREQVVAEEMESLLIRFGQEEDQRLAAQMPSREITLCEDETFHPQICLVAIEPVSNFILVEQYQPQRDAETWQQCASARLAALPVTVCQVTSDAAKAIIAHTEAYLGAHHSPDLFHVQYDTVRATSAALASQTQAALREREKLQQNTAGLEGEYHCCREQCHPWGAEEGSRRLAGHFDTLDQVAAEAGLSAHAREKLAKARRVLDSMQATIAFFWTMIATRLAAWGA